MPVSKRAQIPAGTVQHFALAAAPAGWLACAGGTASRTTEARLFAAIGTTFGAGNGATTFGLPDLRGEFIRGLDSGRGVDAGRALGSAQAFQVGEHLHGIWGDINTDADNTGGGAFPTLEQQGREATVNTDPAGGNTNGSESRPRNVALLACIKR